MNRSSIALLAALFLGTFGAGAVAWRHIAELRGEIAALRGNVESLGGELRAAEQRAQGAERRAAAAESRAGSATEVAQRKAAEAQAAERQAIADREKAAAATGEAEQAQAQSRESMARAEQAFLEAERAKREAAELRRRREQDLDRLARALDRIADTKRTADGVVMNLGDSIEFDTAKADLRPSNRELLSRIAGILLTAEDFAIQVYGHTDDVGDAKYNQKLSERRARSVRDYLVAAGVKPGAITAAGMGEGRPLVAGTSAAARQRNRRVEIGVVHAAGEPALTVDETAR